MNIRDEFHPSEIGDTRSQERESIRRKQEWIPPSDWFSEFEKNESAEPSSKPSVKVLLPNVGKGRFLPEYITDGDSTELVHPTIDFSSWRAEEVFRTLREYSPFHVRSFIADLHYGRDNMVNVDVLNLPKNVRVHGVEYTYVGKLGSGGMATVVHYKNEGGDSIALKVLKENDSRFALRMLEEIANQSVVNPMLHSEGSEKGKPLSAISRVMSFENQDLFSEIAQEQVGEQEWKSLGDEEQASLIQELRDHVAGFIEAVRLVPDTGSETRVAFFLNYESQGDLQEYTREDIHKIRTGENKEHYRKLVMQAIADSKRMNTSLHLIHRLGITHRDVKPGNFLRGADGKLKLADFGISKKDTVRIMRTADSRLQPVHLGLINDAQVLYNLASLAGGIFGSGEKPQVELSHDDQQRIWNWLRDFQTYSYDPELNPSQRKQLLEDLVNRLDSDDGLIEAYGTLISKEVSTTWNPTRWSIVGSVLDDLQLTELPAAEVTNPGDKVAPLDSPSDLASESDITWPGIVMGTPFYMAPEAARGDQGSEKRGAKEDTFSFGVILMKLTGIGKITGGMFQRATAENSGIVLSSNVVSPEEKKAIKARIEERVDLFKTFLEEEQMIEIEEHLKLPGMPRLLGLVKWCLMRNSSLRPSEQQIGEILEQLESDFRAVDKEDIL